MSNPVKKLFNNIKGSLIKLNNSVDNLIYTEVSEQPAYDYVNVWWTEHKTPTKKEITTVNITPTTPVVTTEQIDMRETLKPTIIKKKIKVLKRMRNGKRKKLSQRNGTRHEKKKKTTLTTIPETTTTKSTTTVATSKEVERENDKLVYILHRDDTKGDLSINANETDILVDARSNKDGIHASVVSGLLFKNDTVLSDFDYIIYDKNNKHNDNTSSESDYEMLKNLDKKDGTAPLLIKVLKPEETALGLEQFKKGAQMLISSDKSKMPKVDKEGIYRIEVPVKPEQENEATSIDAAMLNRNGDFRNIPQNQIQPQARQINVNEYPNVNGYEQYGNGPYSQNFNLNSNRSPSNQNTLNIKNQLKQIYNSNSTPNGMKYNANAPFGQKHYLSDDSPDTPPNANFNPNAYGNSFGNNFPPSNGYGGRQSPNFNPNAYGNSFGNNFPPSNGYGGRQSPNFNPNAYGNSFGNNFPPSNGNGGRQGPNFNPNAYGNSFGPNFPPSNGNGDRQGPNFNSNAYGNPFGSYFPPPNGNNGPQGPNYNPNAPFGTNFNPNANRGPHGPNSPPRGPHGPNSPPRGPLGRNAPPRGPHGPNSPPRKPHGPNSPPRGPQGRNAPPRGPHGPNSPPRGPQGRNAPPRGPHGPNSPPRGPHGPNSPPRGRQGRNDPPRGPHGPNFPPRGPHGPNFPPNAYKSPQNPNFNPNDYGNQFSPNFPPNGNRGPQGPNFNPNGFGNRFGSNVPSNANIGSQGPNFNPNAYGNPFGPNFPPNGNRGPQGPNFNPNAYDNPFGPNFPPNGNSGPQGPNFNPNAYGNPLGSNFASNGNSGPQGPNYNPNASFGPNLNPNANRGPQGPNSPPNDNRGPHGLNSSPNANKGPQDPNSPPNFDNTNMKDNPFNHIDNPNSNSNSSIQFNVNANMHKQPNVGFHDRQGNNTNIDNLSNQNEEATNLMVNIQTTPTHGDASPDPHIDPEAYLPTITESEEWTPHSDPTTQLTPSTPRSTIDMHFEDFTHVKETPLGLEIHKETTHPSFNRPPVKLAPYVRKLMEMMQKMKTGYFTVAAINLLDTMALKPKKEARVLFSAYEAEVEAMIKVDHMFDLSRAWLDALSHLAEYLSQAPVDEIQERLKMLHQMMLVRNESFPLDINSVIDYIDGLYIEKEGINLFKVLEKIHDYPKGKPTARSLHRELTDALYYPLVRLHGTEQKEILVTSIIKLIDSYAYGPQIGRRHDAVEYNTSDMYQFAYYKERYKFYKRKLNLTMHTQQMEARNNRTISDYSTKLMKRNHKTTKVRRVIATKRKKRTTTAIKLTTSPTTTTPELTTTSEVTTRSQIPKHRQQRYKIKHNKSIKRMNNATHRTYTTTEMFKAFEVAESTTTTKMVKQKKKDSHHKQKKIFIKKKQLLRLKLKHPKLYKKYFKRKRKHKKHKKDHNIHKKIKKLRRSKHKLGKINKILHKYLSVEHGFESLMKKYTGKNMYLNSGNDLQTSSSIINGPSDRKMSLQNHNYLRNSLKKQIKNSKPHDIQNIKVQKWLPIPISYEPNFTLNPIFDEGPDMMDGADMMLSKKFENFQDIVPISLQTTRRHLIPLSSYSDDEESLKIHIYDAMRHNTEHANARRHDDVTHRAVDNKNLNLLSSYSSEEIVLKSKIYKGFALHNDSARNRSTEEVNSSSHEELKADITRILSRRKNANPIQEVSSYSDEEPIIRKNLKL